MTAQHKNTRIISVSEGRATLEDGTVIDLLKIQAALNYAFQSQGSNLFAEASNALSQITGLQQSAHGEFLASEPVIEVPKSQSTVAPEPVSEEHARLLSLMAQAEKLEAWDDMSEYCREDWQHEVREGDTNLGYKEWVINQIDMAILECTHA